MAKQSRKKRVWPRRAAIALVVALALCGVGFAMYVNDYYHADERAESAMSAGLALASASADAQPEGADSSKVAASSAHDASESGSFSGAVPLGESATVAPIVETDSSIAVGDSACEYGIVFYPGAKVAPQAYVPLACELAHRGVYCVIAKMPFNLAFFGIDSATGLMAEAPQVQHWWLAGHSLGGAMGAQYAASNANKLEGIALLGAYAASDLSATNLKALVIYGENDGVLNREKLAANEQNLPADAQTIVIAGGNHAGFGDYGAQAGDGKASISSSDQQSQTADAISSAMRE